MQVETLSDEEMNMHANTTLHTVKPRLPVAISPFDDTPTEVEIPGWVKSKVFRRTVYGLFIWYCLVLIFAGVVFASAWEGAAINIPPILGIMSLFAWEAVLETVYIFKILCDKVYGRFLWKKSKR